VVGRLRAAGAIVLGKTNLHELSMGWSSNNQAFGPVRNPWNPSLIPGGSSGGTAVAVACGMAPLGVAEDTQGSIRVPAALCGIAGFRPTTGRYPNDGCAPISALFDQIGPHARHVADLALFDTVIAGDDTPLVVPRPGAIRLGIARDHFFAGLDPALAAPLDRVLQRLTDAGVTIVETSLPGLETLIDATTVPVQIHDVIPSLTKWLEVSGAAIGFDDVFAAASPDVRAELARFSLPGAREAISEEGYAAARDVHLPALRHLLANWFAEHRVDAMLLPPTMALATPIGMDETVCIDREDVPFATVVGRNTAPGSTAGLPGLVLPAGLADGLPQAIELNGPAGSDRRLLGIGIAIEAILGPRPQPPGL
jgi:mandelamide amidase